MATFRIYEDQENQVTNLTRNKSTKNVNVPQKRSALGTLTHQTINVPQEIPKKQNIKNVSTKETKTAFSISEDSVETATISKGEIVRKSDKGDPKREHSIPDSLAKLPRFPLQELACNAPKDDDIVSVCSSSYEDELSISVEKSIEFKEESTLSECLFNVDVYRDEIFKYLQQIEVRNRPKACYMRRQPDITYNMRTILVNWLIEVGEEYNLHSETLHIAVYMIDRFLSLMSVVRGKLQLLGTAAMFIASKYEEIYPPEVTEFSYITDNTYTKKQVLRMEHLILKVLMFDISVPTALSFVQIITAACHQKPKVVSLALFLCELTLLEGDPYLQFLPSHIACSALALSRHCLDYDPPWPEDMQKFTGNTLDSLQSCLEYLNMSHAKAKDLAQQGVLDKYRSLKWHSVSEVESKPLCSK